MSEKIDLLCYLPLRLPHIHTYYVPLSLFCPNFAGNLDILSDRDEIKRNDNVTDVKG
jgi:hypothetical protein